MTAGSNAATVEEVAAALDHAAKALRAAEHSAAKMARDLDAASARLRNLIPRPDPEAPPE